MKRLFYKLLNYYLFKYMMKSLGQNQPQPPTLAVETSEKLFKN